MKKTSVTTPVKGGWVTREAGTGRFVKVRTANSASRANTKTGDILKETAARRSAALARLADR
ncbi:hypothetical protein EKE94_18105 [Mesobaculum littorinae]|uniref:Uncharacterized protein n=1 Tax=Mesobaculum littorinae TaxID=2486419 RepID=A0A438ACZ6_9RHOB|nr:hypothetical protein [Mesobaculum littorinae]RVV96560.1 hypothetical protein EKE94_18105 [Mesobaculum littorinae]